jgi:hypothetical protein
MPEVQNCYEMGLLQNPSLKGQLVIEWTITTDGRAANVTVARNSLKNPTVAVCIAAELRNWKFPSSPGGNVVVSYPFTFSPEAF